MSRFTASGVLIAILLSCSAGCSPLAYTAGRYAGNMNRRSLPTDSAGDVRRGSQVWVALRNGKTVSGRLERTGSPHTIVLLQHQASGSPASVFGQEAVPETLLVRDIDHLELARRTPQWIGLGIGLCIDALWISAVASHDTSYKPAIRGEH